MARIVGDSDTRARRHVDTHVARAFRHLYTPIRYRSGALSRSLGGRVWLAIIVAGVLLCLESVPACASEFRELCRIRVVNSKEGRVEVSANGDGVYSLVGRVTRPATVTARGFAASIYAEPGTVAATAVHGIRIKVGGRRECSGEESRLISIIPREFAVSPKGFGGHVAGASGIYTDISTGQAIFRNLAPFVGNRVFKEVGGRLSPLRDGYIPKDGDVLVIIVQVPTRYPKEVIFQNGVGGAVEAVYSDGSERIAVVERPVRGVGRFDATGYTGIGRINTNHTGVVTISTAPIVSGGKDGSGIETRGGFMIQPSRHARLASEVAQVMVVAPSNEGDPWLEGSPPLFSGYIGLAHDPAADGNSFRIDVRTDISDWKPLPPLVGRWDEALARLPDGAGRVTHIRLLFPSLSNEWIASELKRCSDAYLDECAKKARRDGTLVASKDFHIQLNCMGLPDVRFVSLYLDEHFRGASNSPPYSFSIDTEDLSCGEHIAELRAVDSEGRTVKKKRSKFFVQRQDAAPDESGLR